MSGAIFDIAIVGAGIAGSATAFYLARAGKSCLLIEAEAVAAGASGWSAGLITPPIGARLQEPLASLALAAFELHADLPDQLRRYSAGGYDLRRGGTVLVAPDEAAAQPIKALLDHPQPQRRGALWLDPDRVRELCAWIDQPQVGGVFEPGAANLDPERLTGAFSSAAEDLGTRLVVDRISALQRRPDGFTLQGASGGYRASQVVLAAGPWTGTLARQLGFAGAIEPLKGQILRLRLAPPYSPVGFSDPEGNYLAPRPGGEVWIGTTEESVGFDRNPTAAGRRRILRNARRYCSRLEEAQVIAHTACLRPISPDGLPLIGALPGVAGAWMCSGHGRSGMLMGPISARELANTILERATALSLDPFDPGRFAADGV